VPRTAGSNGAEGITIATAIGSTKQGRGMIQGLVNGESEGEGKMPRQSSGGGCSTDLAQRVVTAVSSRLDCAR
jgi:hypothetical protein